jgi:hypothetical protein
MDVPHQTDKPAADSAFGAMKSCRRWAGHPRRWRRAFSRIDI